MSKTNEWLKNLAEYYSHNNPPKIRIEMLAQIFGDVDTAVMDTAVRAYMEDCEHFPQVAQLRPYVDRVLYDSQGARRRIPGRLEILRQRRHELFEAAYCGEVDKNEFAALANEYDRTGHTDLANYVRLKTVRFAAIGEK